MSNIPKSRHAARVPESAPTDIPMRVYNFQRDDLEMGPEREKSGSMQLATEILRKANLLGCSAAAQMAKK